MKIRHDDLWMAEPTHRNELGRMSYIASEWLHPDVTFSYGMSVMWYRVFSSRRVRRGGS